MITTITTIGLFNKEIPPPVIVQESLRANALYTYALAQPRLNTYRSISSSQLLWHFLAIGTLLFKLQLSAAPAQPRTHLAGSVPVQSWRTPARQACLQLAPKCPEVEASHHPPAIQCKHPACKIMTALTRTRAMHLHN